MSWICPHCKRPFKNPHQVHSCIQIRPADILKGKSKTVSDIYHTLIRLAKKFGPFDITAAQKTIFLKHPGTFVAIKPQKEKVTLEFFLQKENNEFPVYKTFRVSKNRVVHFVQLDDVRQVDKQLMGWLQLSYNLISNY